MCFLRIIQTRRNLITYNFMKPVKKNLLLLLLSLFTIPFCYSQPARTDSVQLCVFEFVPGDDMFYIPWKGNGQELTRLYAVITEYKEEITSGRVPLRVDAYSASMREHKRNRNLAFVRANRVKSELIVHAGLKEKHFITRNFTTPYVDASGRAHKDKVVVTLRIPVRAPFRQPEPEPELVVEFVPEPEPEPVPVVEAAPGPLPVPGREVPTGWYLRTNLLYDALLTPTLGVEWRLSQDIGIKLDGSYAYWGNTHGRVQKMWLISPEVRWYVLEPRQLYVGLGANVGEANVYRGLARVLSKDTGYQGNIYGGGLTVGYQLPLNRCLSVDFNLGLGYTRFEYDTFGIIDGVRVYKAHNQTKNLWGPTQVGIGLMWKVGRK